MIQPGAIFAAVKALWDASVLPTLVTGGLWDGPPGESVGPAGAYASATIAEGEAQWDSGTVIQTFTLTVSVYSATGATRADTISRALDRLLGRGRTPRPVVANALLIDVRPVGGDFATDDGRRDAQDVKVAARRWEWVARPDVP